MTSAFPRGRVSRGLGASCVPSSLSPLPALACGICHFPPLSPHPHYVFCLKSQEQKRVHFPSPLRSSSGGAAGGGCACRVFPKEAKEMLKADARAAGGHVGTELPFAPRSCCGFELEPRQRSVRVNVSVLPYLNTEIPGAGVPCVPQLPRRRDVGASAFASLCVN